MVTATAPSITNRGLTEPFELQVSRGLVPFHKIITQSGHSAAVGTTDETVWDGAVVYVYPTTASVMKVSSSSADDAAAGTGARTVYITGIDANGVEVTETVSLNGQTVVLTVSSFLRIFSVIVLTAGSGATAVGNIYVGDGSVTSGVPATVYAKILIGNNRTLMAMFTVPSGYTGYVKSAFGSTGGNAASTDYTDISFAYKPTGGVMLIGGRNTVQSGSFGSPLMLYTQPFAALTDIEIRASGSAAVNRVSATFTVLYIKNDTQS